MNGGGTAVGGGHVIMIPSSDLAYQIYANDPAFTVDGTGWSMGSNDVYCAALRDVLAGFAIGFVDSPVTNPVTSVPFKDEYSKFWYATNQPLAFGGLQTVHPYYNTYAEVFWQYSDSYGFPFSDRLHKSVQANLDPAHVDTVEIVVLQDIPEPSALLALGLLPLLGAVRRRRRAL